MCWVTITVQLNPPPLSQWKRQLLSVPELVQNRRNASGPRAACGFQQWTASEEFTSNLWRQLLIACLSKQFFAKWRQSALAYYEDLLDEITYLFTAYLYCPVSFWVHKTSWDKAKRKYKNLKAPHESPKIHGEEKCFYLALNNERIT